MDFDFRASTIHSSKHLSTAQAARLYSDNYSVFHYVDEDDDDRSYFRCPFCDFEIKVPVLCSSMEEERFSDLKNVVCPVCEETIGHDVIRQFIQQSSSRKWMWKSEKSGIWSGNSAMLGKKLASRGNKYESIPDPLLSPFVCNMSVPNPNGSHPDEDSSNNDLDISDAKCCGTDEPESGDEQDHEERRQRAEFVQNLVFSTIF